VVEPTKSVKTMVIRPVWCRAGGTGESPVMAGVGFTSVKRRGTRSSPPGLESLPGAREKVLGRHRFVRIELDALSVEELPEVKAVRDIFGTGRLVGKNEQPLDDAGFVFGRGLDEEVNNFGRAGVTRLNDGQAPDHNVTRTQAVEFSADPRQVRQCGWSRRRFTAAAIRWFISHTSASSKVLNRYTPLG